MEYRLVFLTPGQQAPDGGQATTISGGLVWVGESLPTEAKLGKILPTDQTPSTTYNHRLMTEDEIYLFNNPPPEDDIEILQTRVTQLEEEVALKDAELAVKTNELEAKTNELNTLKTKDDGKITLK